MSGSECGVFDADFCENAWVKSSEALSKKGPQRAVKP